LSEAELTDERKDNIARMNILLQSKQTRYYVRSVGRWTGATGDAHGFITTIEALCFCYDHALFQMQIVVRFTDGRPETVFDVTDLRF
jgi:hypothetical protein